MEKNISKLRGTLHAYDWLKDIKYSPANDSDIVQVIFKNTRTGFYHNPDNIPLKRGDWVAVEASPGHDIGKVMLTGPLVALQMKKAGDKNTELKRIFRLATEGDMEKFNEAREREHPTMIRSRQIAAELGLNMKIGDVEYQGDGAKAIFYYIADERVDFRKLIRILADTFKIRIEMKQIGARQEAGRIGGIGPCGRPLCCSTWMSKFNSVGTGAARIQDLSMNPQKLAGQCAKLKCCLNFEIESYSEASAEFPSKDIVLITQDQEYFWFKADLLARKISYSTDKKQPVNVVTISVDRAKEIIALNRLGEKPEALAPSADAPAPKKEFVELVGQDSLTRFDKKSKSGSKKGNNSRNNKDANSGTASEPASAGDKKQRKDRKKGRPDSGAQQREKNNEKNNEQNINKNKGRNNKPQPQPQPRQEKGNGKQTDDDNAGKERKQQPNRRHHHRNRPPKKTGTPGA